MEGITLYPKDTPSTSQTLATRDSEGEADIVGLQFTSGCWTSVPSFAGQFSPSFGRYIKISFSESLFKNSELLKVLLLCVQSFMPSSYNWLISQISNRNMDCFLKY